jgi:hypothetical protein
VSFLKIVLLKRTVPILISALATVLVGSSALASGFSDCYAVAGKTFGTGQKALLICAKAGSGFSDCYDVASKIFGTGQSALSACAEPKAE